MKTLFILLAMVILAAADTWAQGCVTCTNTAAGLGAGSAQGLNNGILYLASLPLMFIGTISYMWWKRNRTVTGGEQ